MQRIATIYQRGKKTILELGWEYNTGGKYIISDMVIKPKIRITNERREGLKYIHLPNGKAYVDKIVRI